MDQSKKKKTIVLVIVTLVTIALGAIAVLTSLELRERATVPVAPNAPESQPLAQDIGNSCTGDFTVQSSVCGGWCDDDADCGDDLTCFVETGEPSIDNPGVCRNPACEEEATCTCPTPQHLACVDEACVIVDEEGENECSDNTDCIPQTHLACVDEACVPVDGGGDDLCTDNNDCLPAEHLACVDEACVPVDGEGENTCSSDDQCQEDTHLACQNFACVTVSGSGANNCENDSDCQTTSPSPSPSPSLASPSPSPIAQVPEQQLPEAGITLPTTAMLTAGLGFLILGALSLLLL